MKNERQIELDPSAQRAVEELAGMIRGRFPEATFTVSRAQDDPQGLHLTAIVDIDDPDVVLDTVIGRLLELQTDDELPLTVIPQRTPERAELVRQHIDLWPRIHRGAALPL